MYDIVNGKKPLKKENKQSDRKDCSKVKPAVSGQSVKKTQQSENRHNLYILPSFVETIPFMS